MPAARSVSDEPAVETSCATHISTKSRFLNTAVGEIFAPACCDSGHAVVSPVGAGRRSGPARQAARTGAKVYVPGSLRFGPA